MRLPRVLKTGALVYTITSDRVAHLEACKQEGNDVYGWTDHATCRIVLDPKQVPCQQRDTLMHEILHVLTDTTGLAAEWGSEKDEATVRRLAPQLVALIRDNPSIIGFLTAKD